MGNRRRSRELAMQALFQIELDKDNSSETLELFCKHFRISKKLRSFFFRLVEGVQESLDEIDSLIGQFSENWKMSRMSRVDRNVMRIAVYELLYCEDIPPKVSINEAIDLSKSYSIPDAKRFINGILDQFKLTLDRPFRTAAKD